ncbi:MAG: SRPBCC domain-containing protein [Chloroflexi bacterium]|nr:MAG: SRPBCC domain-containing protein [Chloroflexota bacterium]MBL1195600.1 SRPBCC domain-containing protein [Chloroflexota bacterium]NOH12887.1 SRPBCC domain-containing protein [Chloroflexota bacterium]
MSDLSIHKTYQLDLPRKQLFEAWISPDSVIPPASKIEVDPRVGGYYRLFSGSSIMEGEFLTLNPPGQVVYTWEWDNNGEVTQITVDFKKTEDGTEIVLLHSGFQSEESRAMHDKGWDSYVAGLVEFLKANS